MGRIQGLDLTPADRRELEQWARAATRPHREVQRARMLLGLAAGQTLKAVAAAVGMTDATVATWRDRYRRDGLAGLADRPRSGRPPTYDEAARDAMWRQLREPPRPTATRVGA